MKKKNITKVSIVFNLVLLIIVFNLLIGNVNIIKEKQIIKEMNESTQVTNLNSSINQLNSQHTSYMNYIQTCKTQIATALTNEGVATSDQITLEEMAAKIPNILQAKTSDADATAEDIKEGKTAWVNGELIIGTSTATEGTTPPGEYIGTISGKATMKVDVSKIRSDYQSLTADNFFVRIKKYTLAYTVSDSLAAHNGMSKSVSCSQTYNADTGILTLKNYGYTYTYDYGDIWTKTLSVNATLDVYCTNEPLGNTLSGSATVNPIG